MDCVPFIEMVPSLDTSALSNRSLSAEKNSQMSQEMSHIAKNRHISVENIHTWLKRQRHSEFL